MANPQKRKGTDWERDAAKILEEIIPDSKWKRVAGSGAIGTIMNEPLLAGDIVGYIPALGREIRGEAKVGYGGSKQITFKRKWLQKIREEADGTSALPVVICKFSGARGDSRYFLAIDFETLEELFKQVTRLHDSEIALVEENEILKEKLKEYDEK